jgi:uncharacterized membrane protein HdeD (DUF308 family)
VGTIDHASAEADATALWRSSWRFLLGTGVLLALVGIAAIIYPAVATATVNILAGVFLIIAGVLLFGFAFAARDAGGLTVWIVVGAFTTIVGIVFLAAPQISTVTLTVLLAFWFILSGLTKIVAAFDLRGPDAALVAVNGLISLLLGGLIAFDLPSSGDWAIGLLLGVMFLLDGIVMIAVGWSMRRAGRPAS